jgi:hypothetical protein
MANYLYELILNCPREKNRLILRIKVQDHSIVPQPLQSRTALNHRFLLSLAIKNPFEIPSVFTTVNWQHYSATVSRNIRSKTDHAANLPKNRAGCIFVGG